MKIKLIYPKMQDSSRGTRVKYRLVPPQSLLALAAVTPPGNVVEIHDENITPLHMDDRPDLVGVTVYVASAGRAYEISRRYRRRGIPVVLGGLHVSALPEEAVLHADAIVVGEAEKSWPQVITDAAGGRLRRRYPQHEMPRGLKRGSSLPASPDSPLGPEANGRQRKPKGCGTAGDRAESAPIPIRCRRMIPRRNYSDP